MDDTPFTLLVAVLSSVSRCELDCAPASAPLSAGLSLLGVELSVLSIHPIPRASSWATGPEASALGRGGSSDAANRLTPIFASAQTSWGRIFLRMNQRKG